MSKVKGQKPLPLSDTLRDLAHLPISDLDLSTLLSSNGASATPNKAPVEEAVNNSVERSSLFAQEARSVLMVFNHADVGLQGGRVEDIRTQLDELATGVNSGC